MTTTEKAAPHRSGEEESRWGRRRGGELCCREPATSPPARFGEERAAMGSPLSLPWGAVAARGVPQERDRERSTQREVK